jgi:hypothetical protein
MLLTVLCSISSYYYAFAQLADISGALKKWHTVTLSFKGPQTNEKATPNPFSDYRLNVTFTNGSRSYTVPGFYAADGNAANSSATSGNIWQVRFTPDAEGTWRYTASFRTGTDIAINQAVNAGTSAGFFDGATGTFTISASDKTGRDLRGKGRLEYVGEHYLRFRETGEYFIKVGADAPENTFAYEDFDATPNNKGLRKNWQYHQRDYNASEAATYTWKNGKGTELLGAIKYLADQGMNVFSFLTFSLDGDDDNIFPHLGKTANTTSWNNVYHDRFDVSKLAQWEKVMAYGELKGMYLHFKTQETENDLKMDGGLLGRERKLYYRELIARFGHHLALNWNLGEENDIWQELNDSQNNNVKAYAQFIQDIDPYHHHIVIHSYPNQQNQVYNPLLGAVSQLTGASVQTHVNNVHRDVKKWLDASAANGKKWVVANDEQGSATLGVGLDAGYDRVNGQRPDVNNNEINIDNRNDVRKKVLWGTLMAGGAGVEYYYGYQTGYGDLYCQDHRTRATKWQDAKKALDFFNTYLQPYLIKMTSNDALTADNKDYVFAQAGKVYAIYRPNGGGTTLNLSGQSGSFTVKWFDPRNGGALKNGSVTTVNGGGNRNIGIPPNSTSSDWVALVTVASGNGTTCNADYEEVGGMVIMEAENLQVAGTNWKVQTNVAGFTGNAYINWTGSNSFGNPGNGLITTKINIKTPGKYRFQWRSKVGLGTNSTEHNDSWLRFPDAAAFYGQKGNGSKVYPRGTGLSPNPNGSSKDGWFKIYLSGSTNWTWVSKTSDNDGHDIYVEFDSPGVYTMEVSGRSQSHFIDRIALYRAGNGTDITNPETPCSGNTAVAVTGISLTPANVALEVGQTAQLNETVSPANATDKSVSWSSSNPAIATVNTNGVVTAIAAGTAMITCTTNDGNFTATSTITVSNIPVNAISIPARIEAEDFTNQNGIQTENTTDTGGGKNVGYINDGDFVEYTIDATSAGDYDLDFRVASATSGGTITISSNGNVIGSLNVATTGGWQNWTTLSTRVTLPAGEQTLRLDFSGNTSYLLNVNYIDARLVPVPVTTALSPVHDTYLQGSRNFNQNIIRVESGRRVGYLMFDLSGINGTITDVKLKMTCDSDAGNGNVIVALGNQSNWTETNLSTTNKPNATATLGNLNTAYKVGTTYTWSLDHSAINGGENLSLIVSHDGTNDVAFASSESPALSPQLEITYMPAGANSVVKKEEPSASTSIIKKRRSTLFPNPSNGENFSINLRGHSDKVKVSVFDTFGRLVYERTSEGKQVTINAERIQKAGNYVVYLKSNDKVETLRLYIK